MVISPLTEQKYNNGKCAAVIVPNEVTDINEYSISTFKMTHCF